MYGTTEALVAALCKELQRACVEVMKDGDAETLGPAVPQSDTFSESSVDGCGHWKLPGGGRGCVILETRHGWEERMLKIPTKQQSSRGILTCNPV